MNSTGWTWTSVFLPKVPIVLCLKPFSWPFAEQCFQKEFWIPVYSLFPNVKFITNLKTFLQRISSKIWASWLDDTKDPCYPRLHVCIYLLKFLCIFYAGGGWFRQGLKPVVYVSWNPFSWTITTGNWYRMQNAAVIFLQFDHSPSWTVLWLAFLAMYS